MSKKNSSKKSDSFENQHNHSQISGKMKPSFIKANWLALFTITIALFGGIPGIVDTYRAITSGPDFRVDMQTFMLTEFVKENSIFQRKVLCFIFPIDICNAGTQIFSPRNFYAKIFLNGEWIELDPMTVPEHITQSDTTILLGKLNDLQEFRGSIEPGRYIDGVLMFTSDTITLDNIQSAKECTFEFRTTDAFGKEHLAKSYQKIEASTFTESTKLPGQDIVIHPR